MIILPVPYFNTPPPGSSGGVSITGSLPIAVVVTGSIQQETIVTSSRLSIDVILSGTVAYQPLKAVFDADILSSSIIAELYTGIKGSLPLGLSVVGFARNSVIASGRELNISLDLTGSGSAAYSFGTGKGSLQFELIGSGRSAVNGRVNVGGLPFNLTLLGRGVVGALATGVLNLTTFSIDSGSGYISGVGTGNLELDITLSGKSFIEAYTCLALNIKNFALTEYDLQLRGLVTFNGRQLGASSTKIFELTGDTDNGEPVDWYIKTGKIDLEKDRVNRLRYVWVSYKPSGDLLLTVNTGLTDYEYPITSYSTDDGTVKVKIGRGIKEKYVQLKLSNLTGESIFLDRLRLFTEATTKRR